MKEKLSEINVMSELALSLDHESIAEAMLTTRGDLAKASRLPTVQHNAMSLRHIVKTNPEIRKRYHEMLADEMQEKGLHIAERILKMAELQEKAFGVEYEDKDPESGETVIRTSPADPKMAIELSKEISRLISEGKGQNMSAKAAVVIASKEDAKEILTAFLEA
jgi:hypothetical protein